MERVQKSAVNIIGNKYLDYEKPFAILDMETLKERRENLCLNFALKCARNPKMKNMFLEAIKIHQMETRKPEKYQVQDANAERLNKSAVIYMQNLINENEIR